LNTVKLHTGGCKFVLYLVLMLGISWLVVYKSLFFTTNNNTENIYWDCKGRISSRLYKCLQESLLLDFVMIRIIRLWILKISLLSCKHFVYSRLVLLHFAPTWLFVSVRINRSFREIYCFPLLTLECHRIADVVIMTVAAWRLPIQNTRSSLK
jgi:hypothetical protein